MQSFSGPPQKVVARPGVVAADGMPRYPNLTIPGMLRGSDYVGTASFALTGTLLAASKGLASVEGRYEISCLAREEELFGWKSKNTCT